MFKILLVSLFLAPISAFCVSESYQSYLCEGPGVFRLHDNNPELLGCLQEAFSSASNGQILPEEVSFDSVISDLGGFSAATNKTLDRRLKLKGFPSSKQLNIEEINSKARQMTVSDLAKLLTQTWAEAYCR